MKIIKFKIHYNFSEKEKEIKMKEETFNNIIKEFKSIEKYLKRFHHDKISEIEIS